MDVLEKLNLIVRLWGGSIECVDDISEEFKNIDSDNTGVDYQNKIIFYNKYCNNIFEIIHSAGYVFACKNNSVKDYDFLGWEFSMVKFLELKFSGWIDYNQDYNVSEDPLENNPFKVQEIRCLPLKTIEVLIEERIFTAKVAGLVSKDGRPLNVRI